MATDQTTAAYEADAVQDQVPAPRTVRLPDGVISTDAIEQLSPFVPGLERRFEEADAEPIFESRGSYFRGGVERVLLTAVPLLIGDLGALLGCFGIGALLVATFFPTVGVASLLTLLPLITLTYVGIGLLFGLFPATAFSPIHELRQLVVAASLTFGFSLAFNVMVGDATLVQSAVGVALAAVAIVTLPMMRAIVRKIFSRFEWWGEKVIVIGAGAQGRAIYNFYRRAVKRGLRPVGIVEQDEYSEIAQSFVSKDPWSGEESAIPNLGSVLDLGSIAKRHSARWGIVAPGGCEGMDMLQVINHGAVLPHLIILPSQCSLPSLWVNPRECAGVLGVHIRDQLRNPLARIFKRFSDVLGASIGLVLSSPVFLVAIVLIKLRSPGPVFYGHRRVGRYGDTFPAWKFRTMVKNADAVLEEYLENNPDMRQEWMEDQKLRNDPRIISGIGHFLRKTSLDELPQLWNVLKGEMSLVGPRPIVKSEIERYQEMFPLYLRVRPGITGLWQISGRNDTSYEQRVRLDSFYVCNWSIWLDVYIAVRTIKTILFREGAY